MRIDADHYRSDSLHNVLGSMSGPLEWGASTTSLELTPQRQLKVDWTARRPVILASLVKSLDAETVTIIATLDPDGAAPEKLPAATFALHSETGAALPLYVPRLAPGATSAPRVTLGIDVTVQPDDGPAAAVPITDIPRYLKFEILEGNMGKLLFLLVQEKARVRREGRRLAAAKCLNTARLDALDRMGADTGVPRFQDDLVYDLDDDELKTVILTDAAGNPALESDDDYARRLAIYRPFLLSSRQRMLEMLNGSGQENDENTGLLKGLGLTSRFAVADDNNPFAIAIRILGIGSEDPRTHFVNYVRNDVLTWLPNTPRANTVHAARYEPAARHAEIRELRARLRDAYEVPSGAAVAPVLAETLDRLGRVLKALGHASKLIITRAQDATAGSRYELGLGVDVTVLTSAELDGLAASVNDTTRPVTDDEVAEALILALRNRPPAPSADDPDGAWLLSTCGFQTVHRLGAATLYLSHLPILGLVVDGPTMMGAGAAANFDAHFFPAEDPAINAALLAGLESAAADWAAAGQAAWTPLTPAEQASALDQVAAQPANGPAMETFAAAGLPAIPDPADIVTSLDNVPADMMTTISLDAGLASAILAGDPAAMPTLRNLVDVLKDAGVASAVPLVTTTNAVILVVSVLGLPQIGVNLAERRASGFRWYTVPLGGAGSAKGFGSTTDVHASTAGAIALVCLGYVRQGMADPYELAIQLPDQATLTLHQYEFLMNALQRICPVGVQINTYELRRKHVDLNGDGIAEPLSASVSKTYRSFVRTRLRGIYQQQTP
jgi:hypothetical protein